MLKKGMGEDYFHKFAWSLIVAGGVAISSWSLFLLARSGSVPVPIAVFTGATYDGLAFVSSVQAMKWNRLSGNTSGITARLTMLGAAGLSAWMNWCHGGLMHSPLPVKVMLAMAPIAGLLALENHVRYLHRTSMKSPVPRPRLAFSLLFPIKAFKLLRLAYWQDSEELMGITLPMASGQVSPETIRVWLRDHGQTVAETGPISRQQRALFAKAMNGGGELCLPAGSRVNPPAARPNPGATTQKHRVTTEALHLTHLKLRQTQVLLLAYCPLTLPK